MLFIPCMKLAHTYTHTPLRILVLEFINQAYTNYNRVSRTISSTWNFNVTVADTQFIQKCSAKILQTLFHIVWPSLKSKRDRQTFLGAFTLGEGNSCQMGSKETTSLNLSFADRELVPPVLQCEPICPPGRRRGVLSTFIQFTFS